MHVERVAPGRPVGPAGASQTLAADDGAETLEQRLGEPGFDRRQRHPDPTETQDTVVVEAGRG